MKDEDEVKLNMIIDKISEVFSEEGIDIFIVSFLSPTGKGITGGSGNRHSQEVIARLLYKRLRRIND